MERLPIRFEEEVLEPADICWDDIIPNESRYVRGVDCMEYCYVDISIYEIAGLGLEAMKLDLEYMLQGNEWVIFEKHFNKIGGRTSVAVCSDKDFAACIFNAIRCIYG